MSSSGPWKFGLSHGKKQPRENLEKLSLGRRESSYIHGNLAYYNYGHDLFDVCDAYSQELCELFTHSSKKRMSG